MYIISHSQDDALTMLQWSLGKGLPKTSKHKAVPVLFPATEKCKPCCLS